MPRTRPNRPLLPPRLRASLRSHSYLFFIFLREPASLVSPLTFVGCCAAEALFERSPATRTMSQKITPLNDRQDEIAALQRLVDEQRAEIETLKRAGVDNETMIDTLKDENAGLRADLAHSVAQQAQEEPAGNEPGKLALEKVQKQLIREIKTWCAEFEAKEHRKPDRNDKKHIREKYVRLHECRQQLAMISSSKKPQVGHLLTSSQNRPTKKLAP